MRRVRVALKAVWRAPARAAVLVLLGYRRVVSPLYGQVCRFYPSCSAYAVDAYRLHGFVRGSWLTVRRLLRCNPWNPGGVDLVPGAADPLAQFDHRESVSVSHHHPDDGPDQGRHHHASGPADRTWAA